MNTADPLPATVPENEPHIQSESLFEHLEDPLDTALPEWARSSPLMREYYLSEWGVPIYSEHGVFERLTLEAFQCGLSWATILKKRPAFREVFHGFEIDAVATMNAAEIDALASDARIIRNRQKINATINNARSALELREQGTNLAEFVWSFLPSSTYVPRTQSEVPAKDQSSVALSKALKKRGFSFVGPTTCFALMEALGMHDTHLISSPRRGSSGIWNLDGSVRKRPAICGIRGDAE